LLNACVSGDPSGTELFRSVSSSTPKPENPEITTSGAFTFIETKPWFETRTFVRSRINSLGLGL